MEHVRRRPFYSDFAWAFDLIIDRPVRKECAVIAAWLIQRGVLPGGRILDAGCGTGRYAFELTRRGFIVHGIDLVPELVEIAKQAAGVAVSFAVGDLLAPREAVYDAVLCRGVLNDITEDDDRASAFDGFAGSLRPGGVAILDVREWHASADRKAREPLFRKRVSTDRGELTFTSVTELDPEHRQLLVSERHALRVDDGELVTEYRFVMRCWTRDELESMLTRAGFTSAAWFGAYDEGVEAGATDRLVVVAQSRGAG